MSVLPRIAELRTEAERAIAQASSTDSIEQARVQYLGRRAELPQLLRGVAELAPEERGPSASAANEARQALEARRRSARPSWLRRELDAAAGRRPRRRHAARDAAAAGRPPAPAHRTRAARSRTSSSASASRSPRAPRSSRHYNFDALNHSPDASRAGAHRHLLRAAPARGRGGGVRPARDMLRGYASTSCCAPTRRRCRSARWRRARRRCTWSSPAASTAPTPTRRTRRSSTRSRAWPSTRTSRSPT